MRALPINVYCTVCNLVNNCITNGLPERCYVNKLLTRQQEAEENWKHLHDEVLPALTEENDIQRQAIQNLSAQVAGLRELLTAYPYDLHNPNCKCPECEWLDKREKLLSSPDPGEKYRAVVEAAKEFISKLQDCQDSKICNINECYICEHDYEPAIEALRQVLADLEGRRQP